VAAGDAVVLSNLRRLCLPKALLQVILLMDLERDRCELQRLGLPAITIDYARTVLAQRYTEAGFHIVESKLSSIGDVPELQTSWARRLQGSSKPHTRHSC